MPIHLNMGSCKVSLVTPQVFGVSTLFNFEDEVVVDVLLLFFRKSDLNLLLRSLESVAP